jgi:hypothetical protein
MQYELNGELLVMRDETVMKNEQIMRFEKHCEAIESEVYH